MIVMSLEGTERKWSWPTLSSTPIYPEMTAKIHKNPVGITGHCTINQIPEYKTLSEWKG